jgi:transcriptional regulator with XRE-family HTH domain
VSLRGGFAELLRELRGEESVTAVAARMGVTRQTLLDLENGRSNPTLDRVDRLGAAYGVRFDVTATAVTVDA